MRGRTVIGPCGQFHGLKCTNVAHIMQQSIGPARFRDP
jgi:hypothetical protein